MRRLSILLVALLFAMLPVAAFAEDGENRGGVLLRIDGDVTIAQGETVESVFVVDGDVRIDGIVTSTVFVVSGNVIVTGEVREELVVISGNIELADGARVRDVASVSGDLVLAPGAIVTGEIEEGEGYKWADLGGFVALFSFLFWIAITVSIVAAGLLFAGLGGRALTRSGRNMTDAAAAAIGAAVVWILVPILAVVAMITLIGLPFGLGVLFFVLPTLWFLGYIVAGQRLGAALLGLLGRQPKGDRPYLATGFGLLLLQAFVLVPVIGGMIAAIAGAWGAAAIAVSIYRGASGGLGSSSSPTAPAPASPQAV
jgi:hypothetical protein